jgi:hypothetical protein
MFSELLIARTLRVIAPIYYGVRGTDSGNPKAKGGFSSHATSFYDRENSG